jgi:hypothetical protein
MKKGTTRFAYAFLLGVSLMAPIAAAAATPDNNNGRCTNICLTINHHRLLCLKLLCGL